MKTMILEEEAQNLKARFVGKNRAQFARDYDLSGGQSMIYQHINGLRPIGMDAAKSYARGFGCALEDISPRLAQEAVDAAKHLVSPADSPAGTPRYTHISDLAFDQVIVSHDERRIELDAAAAERLTSAVRLLTFFNGTDDEGRSRIMKVAEKVPMITKISIVHSNKA